MARIFKYQLMAEHRQMFQMHRGSKVLHLAMQYEMPCLWVHVPDEEAPVEPRIFRMVTTGEIFNDEGLEFVGSFQAEDWFVGHVYEQPTKNAAPDPISDRFRDDFKQVKNEQAQREEDSHAH